MTAVQAQKKSRVWVIEDDTVEALARIRVEASEEIAASASPAPPMPVVPQVELAKELDLANRQLQTYASDLQHAYSSMKQLEGELEEAYLDTLVRLMRAARFRDDETGAHLIRISHYSKRVAEHIGLDKEEVRRIAAASPLHDVGKIGIPDAILGKKGKLDPEEWEIMQSHTDVGAALMSGTRSELLRCAGEIALCHHEKFDGSGYPRKLSGTDIPMSARIVSIVDCYDALRSRRCYKPAFTPERTNEIILKGDGRLEPTHFDPDILQAFRELNDEMAAIFDEHVTEGER